VLKATIAPRVKVVYEGDCAEGSSNSITITSPSDCGEDPDVPCEFEFELDLVVPIPKPPCDPTFIVRTQTIGYSFPPFVAFAIEKEEVSGSPCEQDKCNFYLDLAIGIVPPICPIVWRDNAVDILQIIDFRYSCRPN
jgi:hypothetical protein